MQQKRLQTWHEQQLSKLALSPKLNMNILASRQVLTHDEFDRRSRDDMDQDVPDKGTPAYVAYLERIVERHLAAETRRRSA